MRMAPNLMLIAWISTRAVFGSRAVKAMVSVSGRLRIKPARSDEVGGNGQSSPPLASAARAWSGSGVEESLQKLNGTRQDFLFFGAQLPLDAAGQPVFPGGTGGTNQLAAGFGSRQQCLPPSVGWGAPFTRPAVCKVPTMAPIDCGRTPSARANEVTVAGPSRSSRPRTEICDQLKPPDRASSRRRRRSLPTSTRRSAARSGTWPSAQASNSLIKTVRSIGKF